MEITNWYKDIKGSGIKNDKNFKNHLIKPNSMIAFIGQTGAGKSNCMVELLSRQSDKYFRIIYFTPSTADEPLVHLLESHIEGIEVIDDVDNLPNLDDFKDEDKKQEKLVIFDDILNLNKKQLTQISKFYCSARKYGFTCIVMSQNYTGIPLNIRRNCQYFFLFKMTDINTINNIIKTHNLSDVDKNEVKQAYLNCIKNPMNFMLIDLTANSPMPFRYNFLVKLDL